MPTLLIVVPIASLLALITAYGIARWINEQNRGTEQMITIAGYIREGAIAYLKQQYKTSGIFFLILFAILLFIAYGLHALSVYVPYAFLTGVFFSGLSGFIGMLTSTNTSSRTTHAARKSLNEALRLSFRGGSVMGLVVVGLGLLDIIIWFYFLNYVVDIPNLNEKLHLITTTMLSFGFGASSQALFARVGGGIFTKAADMGADLVGKVEAGIPEDDPRNPAVIADNVGDNVGDVAGMGADLYESFVGSILGTAALAVSAGYGLNGVLLPMIIGSVGTLASIIGVFTVHTSENVDQRKLLSSINRGINITSILTLVITLLVIKMLMPEALWMLYIPILAGILVGVAVGYATDYYTNAAYPPVHRIVSQAKTGHATVVTAGFSVGMISVTPSIVFIIMGTLFAYIVGGGMEDISKGLYAVGLAAVGMLSTLGINLATDAFGPIADNAGGIAEMAELPSETRVRTDALDELGNSTAARGKGLSIGAAAMTAVTLIAAFIEEIRAAMIHSGTTTIDITVSGIMAKTVNITDASVTEILLYMQSSLLDIRFISGLFIGAIIISSFGSKTIEAVSEAAGEMIDEVRRQFREIPGVMTGETTPDYASCVRISTLAAQKKMVNPALIVILTPIFTGLLLGPVAVIGLLLGNLVVGFLFAVFMANAGGAWDNAKKFIERSKSELKFTIQGGVRDVSKRGLWPFFLTRNMSRFLFEKVNLNPQAFSIDEEVSEAMGDIIEYTENNYLKKDLSVERIALNLTPGQKLRTDDKNLNELYARMNSSDQFMYKQYLKLLGEDRYFLLKMKEIQAQFSTILNSYGAAVTGDTVGDPLKDTSGPSLNIAIKLSTMVSIVTIGLVIRFNLMDWLFK
ncbi:MAG TPA: sodium-translocating pyrophosphatase [Candidatus Marinimicrobia bacterium]|nr:sodium-translocating pyrophosphatase [Candidatus Neomarinimicrobiota bacterium]